MAIDLIATAGAADANSYVTLETASYYFGSRLHSDDWDGAGDDEERKAALITATGILDSHCEWRSYRMTDTQALGWPRASIDVDGVLTPNDAIPGGIVKVTCELALTLLERDRTKAGEASADQISDMKVGPLSFKFDRAREEKVEVISNFIRRMLRPYAESVHSESVNGMVKIGRS